MDDMDMEQQRIERLYKVKKEQKENGYFVEADEWGVKPTVYNIDKQPTTDEERLLYGLDVVDVKELKK
jgi:hypothetical protein